MTRSMSAAMSAAMIATEVRPIILFKAEFTSGWVRVWTGLGPLGWDSATWDGIGDLMDVSATDETNGVKATGITVSLSAANLTRPQQVLTEMRSGKPGIVYLGLMDTVNSLIADPRPIFRGRMDSGEVDDRNPARPIIRLQFESELVDLERPREWRWTDKHQRLLYSNDPSLRYMESLQDKKITWGNS